MLSTGDLIYYKLCKCNFNAKLIVKPQSLEAKVVLGDNIPYLEILLMCIIILISY